MCAAAHVSVSQCAGRRSPVVSIDMFISELFSRVLPRVVPSCRVLSPPPVSGGGIAPRARDSAYRASVTICA